jgi:hypothetical protein
LIAGAHSAQANLIQNGSFESPVTPTNSIARDVTVPLWSNPLVIFNGSINGLWPLAFHGSQFADIGNDASLPGHGQSFVVGTAGNYTLSWAENTGYYGTETAATSPYLVTITGGVLSQSFDAFNFGTWQVKSLSLYFAVGNYTLHFAPQGDFGGYDTLIDAVSLTSASVPDQTSSVLALSSAILMLVFARQRIQRLSTID